jgi:hypothetical protein
MGFVSWAWTAWRQSTRHDSLVRLFYIHSINRGIVTFYRADNRVSMCFPTFRDLISYQSSGCTGGLVPPTQPGNGDEVSTRNIGKPSHPDAVVCPRKYPWILSPRKLQDIKPWTAHPLLFGWTHREEWDGWGMWHVWGRGQVYTGFWCGNLWERAHLEDPGVDRKSILRRIFRQWDVGVWTGISWLRIGTGGGHLWMR